MSDWVDIGSGVFYKFHTCGHVENDESSGALVRFGGNLVEDDATYDHDNICVGGVSWCNQCDGPTWDLKSLDPLHIEPSVKTTCHNHPEHHGYIRDGKWVEC